MTIVIGINLEFAGYVLLVADTRLTRTNWDSRAGNYVIEKVENFVRTATHIAIDVALKLMMRHRNWKWQEKQLKRCVLTILEDKTPVDIYECFYTADTGATYTWL